ncbi:hypothetical protein GCM10027190_52150 [Spirosoma areae]
MSSKHYDLKIYEVFNKESLLKLSCIIEFELIQLVLALYKINQDFNERLSYYAADRISFTIILAV